MINAKLDTKKLKMIKMFLQIGDMSQIARELNLSRQTVYKCMKGEILNLKVLKMAMRKAELNREILEKIAK